MGLLGAVKNHMKERMQSEWKRDLYRGCCIGLRLNISGFRIYLEGQGGQ